MAKNDNTMSLEFENEKNIGGIRVRRVIAYIVLVLVSVLCLFWFYVLFINTTRSNGQITAGFSPFPGKFLFFNIKNIMKSEEILLWNGLINSLFVSGSTALLCTYFSTMTAFAIHAYDFKFKKFIFTFILMIMMIPTQVTALGFLQLIDDMKLANNFIPLIIPAIASPSTFFYMKQYMDSTLPLSIVEAARIDGSNEFRTFNTIVLPMMKPAIAVQAIFSFVSSWNNYFTPALVLTKDPMKTLPLWIAFLRSADFAKFDMGQVYAMITCSILPVIVVYLFLSKFIVQGIALGSVKG